MAQEVLQVSAVSTPDNWTLTAGASKVAAVSQPDDDATSYLTSQAVAGSSQRFAVSNTSANITSSDIINFVQVVRRVRRTVASNLNHIASAHLGGSSLDGAQVATAGSGWVTTTDTFNTKPGGGAWAKADVDALEIQMRVVEARQADLTTFYVVVDFTKASADTGAGVDASASLAASLASAEVAAGVDLDALTATSASADAGAGVDDAALSASLVADDPVAGVESSSLSAVSLDGDLGAAVEVEALAAGYVDDEAVAALDDGVLAVSVALDDVAAGLDASALAVTIVSADAGAGVDDSPFVAPPEPLAPYDAAFEGVEPPHASVRVSIPLRLQRPLATLSTSAVLVQATFAAVEPPSAVLYAPPMPVGEP